MGLSTTRVKIKPEEIKREITMSAIFGELSCLERILTFIIKDKTLKREDIEAEIHLAVVEYNNLVHKELGVGQKISLEKYLELRGYYEKR